MITSALRHQALADPLGITLPVDALSRVHRINLEACPLRSMVLRTGSETPLDGGAAHKLADDPSPAESYQRPEGTRTHPPLAAGARLGPCAAAGGSASPCAWSRAVACRQHGDAARVLLVWAVHDRGRGRACQGLDLPLPRLPAAHRERVRGQRCAPESCTHAPAGLDRLQGTPIC